MRNSQPRCWPEELSFGSPVRRKFIGNGLDILFDSFLPLSVKRSVTSYLISPHLLSNVEISTLMDTEGMQ